MGFALPFLLSKATGNAPHRPYYLETVLVLHEVLGFALVRRLHQGAGRLRGQEAPCRSVGVLRQVQLRHLHADLVTHYVLELLKDGE